MRKFFFFLLAALLFPLQSVFSMSVAYVRPEENFDSEVLLRKFGQAPEGNVSFSEFVYNRMSDNTLPVSVYVHFAGMGKEIYQRYGHTGLILEYESGERIFFDWGNFNANKPNFVNDFVHGRLLYSLSVHTIDFWESYLASEGRSSRFYKLRMSDSQKRDLQNFLFFNSRPENLNYYYDFFKDNCSTRVRDVLNRVYEGKLYDDFSTIPQGTLRRAVERAVRPLPAVEFIYNFGQGPSQDVPISYYDAMFLPGYLEAGLKKFAIAELVPLSEGERMMYDRVVEVFDFLSLSYFPRVPGCHANSLNPNEVGKRVPVGVIEDFKQGDYEVIYPESVVEGVNLPPAKMLIYVILAVLIAINFLSFALPDLAGRIFRALSLAAACFVEFAFGILSLALIYFSSFTRHSMVYFNFNLIFANPLMFVLAYYSFRYAFEEEYESKHLKAIALEVALCVIAVVSKLFYRQENLYLILAFGLYFLSLAGSVLCKNADYAIDLRRWLKKSAFRFG